MSSLETNSSEAFYPKCRASEVHYDNQKLRFCLFSLGGVGETTLHLNFNISEYFIFYFIFTYENQKKRKRKNLEVLVKSFPRVIQWEEKNFKKILTPVEEIETSLSPSPSSLFCLFLFHFLSLSVLSFPLSLNISFSLSIYLSFFFLYFSFSIFSLSFLMIFLSNPGTCLRALKIWSQIN